MEAWGRCRVLVVVPRRVLAYNPWKKEIDRWFSDLKPNIQTKCSAFRKALLQDEREVFDRLAD